VELYQHPLIALPIWATANIETFSAAGDVGPHAQISLGRAKLILRINL
jgi:hypothetical protein